MLLIGLATVMCAAVVALGTALVAGSWARVWLDFKFNGVPAGVASTVHIFLNNSKLVTLALVASAVAQARGDSRRSARWGLSPGAMEWLQRACDLGLTLTALINVTIVGLSVGVYGWRMCVAMLPHGPIEVAAYCVVLRLYFVARSGCPVRRRDWAMAGGIAFTLLAIAALLETFAWAG
jgi:hypothetical protein